ncbi:MAG: hypothetical protein RIS46_1152 [Actinomycetota bacterium]
MKSHTPCRLGITRIRIALTIPTMPVIALNTILPNPSRNSIWTIDAGAPVLISTILRFSIFLAGDVDCCHNTMFQINQPIPHVTTNSNESSSKAPKRTPLPHGTTPIPSEPELFDGGGGGGGEENGSDIEVSLLMPQRMERIKQIIGHHRIASEPNKAGTT